MESKRCERVNAALIVGHRGLAAVVDTLPWRLGHVVAVGDPAAFPSGEVRVPAAVRAKVDPGPDEGEGRADDGADLFPTAARRRFLGGCA